MLAQRVYLGLSIDVGRLRVDGSVLLAVKPGFDATTQLLVDSVFDSERCGSGMASKIRGKHSWAATGTFGRCGRGGQAALIQRQYYDPSDELTPALQSNLIFHMLLPKLVGPRMVNVVRQAIT